MSTPTYMPGRHGRVSDSAGSFSHSTPVQVTAKCLTLASDVWGLWGCAKRWGWSEKNVSRILTELCIVPLRKVSALAAREVLQRVQKKAYQQERIACTAVSTGAQASSARA